MKKENTNVNSYRFYFIFLAILLFIIIIFIAINFINNKQIENKFNIIAEGASNFTSGTISANSYVNEFSYDYSTNTVKYQPKITLENYNKIEKGMKEFEVINLIGNSDQKNNGENTVLVSYGDLIKDGYQIQIIYNLNDLTVISKSQVGLK